MAKKLLLSSETVMVSVVGKFVRFSEGPYDVEVKRGDVPALIKFLREIVAEDVLVARVPQLPAVLVGPLPEHRVLAADLGLDLQGISVDQEWGRYVDWQANAPKRQQHKDRAAGFRNWLRRAKSFAGKQDKRGAVAAAIWGSP
jgi:hypothetical protein